MANGPVGRPQDRDFLIALLFRLVVVGVVLGQCLASVVSSTGQLFAITVSTNPYGCCSQGSCYGQNRNQGEHFAFPETPGYGIYRYVYRRLNSMTIVLCNVPGLRSRLLVKRRLCLVPA
jgi:hypothetical protein